MSRQVITTADAPASPLFSQGIKAGPWVYVSGMTGMDPHTKQLAGAAIQAQTRQALANCEQVLNACGATRDDVVEVQVLLTRPEDFAGMNEAYAEFFKKGDPPARSVAKLGVELPGLLVSIRITAYAPHARAERLAGSLGCAQPPPPAGRNIARRYIARAPAVSHASDAAFGDSALSRAAATASNGDSKGDSP